MIKTKNPPGASDRNLVAFINIARAAGIGDAFWLMSSSSLSKLSC